MPDYTALQVVWFVLISILWLGYFVLEGFDFGVGMLIKVLGRDDAEKRAIIHTIGPLWDGNEVWLLVAGGATFAAFPQWYATLFSGFYLALFLILVGLIVRNVSFEFWGKGESAALAPQLGVGDDDRQRRPRPALGGRLGEHRPRRADRRAQGIHRLLAHPAASVRASWRRRDAADLSRPRLGLPHPEDRGGAGREGEGDRRPHHASRRCGRRRLSRLDRPRPPGRRRRGLGAPRRGRRRPPGRRRGPRRARAPAAPSPPPPGRSSSSSSRSSSTSSPTRWSPAPAPPST